MGKWEMVRLGDVFDIGSSKRVFQSEWRDSGVPFYRAREIVKLACDGYVDNELFIDETMYDDYARKYGIPSEGDIMVTGVGTLGVCYIVKSSDRFYFKDGNILWFKKRVPVNSKYIISLFDTSYIKEQIQRNSSGTTVGTFTISTANKIQIPFPPLSVQEKIADVLDRASTLIEKRKTQIEKLDLLVKSQFVEMFGDPVTNPKGWEIKKLGAVTSKITDGVHQKPVYTNSGVPFISVVNLNKGFLNFSDCKFVSEEDYTKMTKSVSPEYGDVLYTKVGATYGIPAFVDTREKFCLYVSVSLIKPIHEQINARFLALSMAMPYIKYQADKRIKGIGVPDLHLNQIREFDICVPPQEEQEIFLHFVQQVEAQKSLLQQSLAKLEQNYKSLIQKCFRGEIF